MNPEGEASDIAKAVVASQMGFEAVLYGVEPGGKSKRETVRIGINTVKQKVVIIQQSMMNPKVLVTVRLRDVDSFVMGPETFTFKQVLKEKRVDDHALCISLLKSSKTSINLAFKERAGLVKFIIALSELVSKFDSCFFKLTSKHVITTFLFKIKLKQIASSKRVTMGQLILEAITNAFLAKDTDTSLDKVQKVHKLTAICERKQVVLIDKLDEFITRV